MKFAFNPMQLADGSTVHRIYFYDEISRFGEWSWKDLEYKESETSAKFIRDRLAEIPNGATIEIHVNSRGGDVGEGTAIYNLLRQKSQAGCKIIGYVDGYAYSIAMTIVMACDEIHMGLGTSMYLHMPWACVAGNAAQLRSMADDLDVLGEASLQLYLNRSHDLTEEQLRDMMVKETTLAPEDCFKYGFCDVVDTYTALDTPGNEPQQLQNPITQAKISDVAEMLRTLKDARKPPEPAPAPTDNKPNMMSTLIAAMKGV